jgi:hypothetical protein
LGTYASTTTLASAIITKHKKTILEKAASRIVAGRFAVLDHEAVGESGTVRWARVLRFPKITTAATEGTLFAESSARDMTSNYIEASPSKFEDAVGIGYEADVTSWIGKKQAQDEIADQIARTCEYQLIKEISTGGIRTRIDADTTYEVNGTADSGSTTTMVDDARTEADDAWNGGFLTYTGPEGPNYDVTQKVSDFVASTDTLTTAAFNHTPTTSSKYHLCVGTGIVATDIMTTTGLIVNSAIHEALNTPRFKGGIYRMFLHAGHHRDLWSDDTFKNSAIYDNSGRFETYRIGRWFDQEFYVSSELYQEDADGTENQSSGAVAIAPCFGKGAYGLVYWGNGSAKYGVDMWHVNKPDSQNLTLAKTWLSWRAYFAPKTLCATRCVNTLAGYTALPATL